MSEIASHYFDITTNASLTYKRKFDVHDFSALVLAETFQRNSNNFNAKGYGFDIYDLDELNQVVNKDKNIVGGVSAQRRRVGFVGRVNYAYNNKYLLELSARYDGHDTFGRMEAGKRWGLFPALSVGWRITEEQWFKEATDIFDDFKLRFGVGKTGVTGGVDQYSYLNTLSPLNPSVVFNGKPVSGLYTNNPANTGLTWEKHQQYNIGVDASIFKGLLSLEFDVFYKYIYDIIGSPGAAYPPSWGGFYYSLENINKKEHKGFEISLSHKNKINDFRYQVTANVTYTNRRWLKYHDSVNTPDWLKLTGKEEGAQIGFISDGLFQSQEEINNSALITGKPVRVGDIKYIDRNGDGVISYEQDRGYIGKSAYPKFVGGLTISADWRGIDFNILFQGAFGRDVALTGLYAGGIMDHTSMTRPFYHGGNSPSYLLERSWTEENKAGEFPRLSLVPASSNNAYSSDFWYKNGDYLRLKTMQVGYTFSQSLLARTGIYSLRVFVEGQNILTFSDLTKYNIDPEQPGVSNGYYPQQKVFSGGIKVTF